MTSKKSCVLLTVLFLVFVSLTPALHAEELKEGMTQGEFALWLVKEVGAFHYLPPAAQGQDAIDFLIGLGVAPKEGWDADAPVTKEFLASLLDTDEDVSGLTFEDLVKRVRDQVRSRMSDRHLGVFRATSSASSSAPAA